MEKYSKQREEVLSVLEKSYSHPTAEEIYSKVKQNNSTASRGTVYRNLAYFEEKGVIIKIPIKDGADRYDYIRDEHSHAICEDCGRVFDFYFNFNFENLKEIVSKSTGIELSTNGLVAIGRCQKCLNSFKKNIL